MTFAHWCILIAAALPYVWVGLAKARPGYNNHAPRAYADKLEGWRRRANWAQLNAFESFPPFAAGVLLAHSLSMPQARLDLLAGLHIGFRILHGILYIADQATLRSVVWGGGLACVVALYLGNA